MCGCKIQILKRMEGVARFFRQEKVIFIKKILFNPLVSYQAL